MPSRSKLLFQKRLHYEVDKGEDENDEADESKSKRFKYSKRKEEEYERFFLNNSRDVQERIYHNRFPAFNICESGADKAEDLRTYPNCRMRAPEPIYVADREADVVDICHIRPLAYKSFRTRLQNTRTRYLTALERNRNGRNLEKHRIYQHTLFDFAERLACNPDPYFYGAYDYYYTHGNLCVLPQKSNQPVVLHTVGENLRDLNASTYLFDSGLTSLCSHSFDSLTSEIFELRSLNAFNQNRPNCFAMRSRNDITLNYLRTRGDDEDEIVPAFKLSSLTEFKTKTTPFSSLAQMASDPTRLMLSNMKQQIRIYDLNRAQPAMMSHYKLSTSDRQCWNVLKPWQAETFLYANDRYICLLDLRTSPQEWLKRRSAINPITYSHCDMITSLATSVLDNNLVYVGTTHMLHCIDPRRMSKTLDAKGAVCCWTHQLQYAPAFIDSQLNEDNEELIALSSALAGDTVICELTRAQKLVNVDMEAMEPKYTSYTLPIQPPTLEEALHSARLATKCLRPSADLKRRTNSCTTGLAFCEPQLRCKSSDQDIDDLIATLLIANSVGDVYAHKVLRRSTQEPERRIDADSNEVMSLYAEQIEKVNQPTLHYTEIHDLEAVRNIFCCSQLNASQIKNEENTLVNETPGTSLHLQTPITTNYRKRQHLGRWQKSMSTLHNYKDALVQDLLSIWDIDFEKEESMYVSQFDKADKLKNERDNVNEWLHTQVPLQPMLSIPINNMEKLNTSALMNDTAGADEWMGTTALSMSRVSSLKTAKRKSKYVKGF